MPFMQPEITDKREHIEVTERDGSTYYLPGNTFTIADAREFHPEAQCIQLTRIGYLGRYQAPGYLDATDWSFDRNRRRLERELRQMYGSETD
jgi:hypothetical protein